MSEISSIFLSGDALAEPPFRRGSVSGLHPLGAVPRLPRPCLVRVRLEDRLSDWAPVTVIRGAQGCGKTSLVASWLSRQGAAQVLPLWINVTADLANREAMLGHLTRRMSWLRESAGLGPETSPSVLVSLDEFLLRVTAGRTVALVFDNAQHMTDPVLMGELVSLLQRHNNLHLFLCTRDLHPNAALLGSGLEINTVAPEELLFTADEITQLAVLLGRPASRERVGAVQQAVGGWAAPVRLALGCPDGLAAADSYLRYAVFPALAEQPDFRALMRLSLAEHLHFDLASDLDAFGILREFEQSGLVQRRVIGGRTEFTFPTLIRDILRDNYTDTDPTAARAFHHRLAVRFASQGLEGGLSAFRHAVTARDLDLAQQVWAEHGLVLARSSSQPLYDALLTLTKEEFVSHPSLRVAAATLAVLTKARPHDGLMPAMNTYFDACGQVLAEGTEGWPEIDLLFVGNGHLIGLRGRGQLRESAAFGEYLEARLRALGQDDPSLNRYFWSSHHYNRALTYTLLGAYDKAMDNYKSAWNYGVRDQTPHLAIFAAANLALIHAIRGDLVATRQWLACVEPLPNERTHWIDEFGASGAIIARALLALDQGDLATVQAELADLDAQHDAPRSWPFSAFLHAQYGLHHGDPAQALSQLDRAIEAHADEAMFVDLSQTLLLRARLDLMIASGAGQRARDLLPADSDTRPLFAIPLARIHVMTGEAARARSITAHLLELHPRPRERLELLLIQASAALSTGDHTAAAPLLARASEMALDTGIHRSFAVLSSQQQQTAHDLGTFVTIAARAPIYPETLKTINLTNREWILIDALAGSRSRQQIANELFVSLNTVKTQLAVLYNKLGAQSRDEALMRQQELGLQRTPLTEKDLDQR